MNTKKVSKRLNNLIVKLFGRRIGYCLRYFHNRGRWPRLKHPMDLSEILISRILNNDFVKYASFADKIQVREYVKKKGLEEHLLKHYHYWDDASKITMDELPEKFVLKTSNGAGGKNIFVCKNKQTFDLESAKKQLALALTHKSKYELQYNVIKPQVICEELIDTGSEAWPTDYKFTCIHGEPVDVFLCNEREKHVRYSTRNIDWSELNYTKKKYLPNTVPPKPMYLEKMVEIAKILSADFDFVRVDLYEYNNNVYFGELTFSPWGGLMYSYTNEAIKAYGQKLRNNK